MGGTSGGPQALPSPPASGTEGAAAGSPSVGTADVDDGGLDGDPIGPGGAPADPAPPLPPSFLTDGVGLGQPNLPDDVFLSSGLMAENGTLDAPTFVATPDYLGGLKTAPAPRARSRQNWSTAGPTVFCPVESNRKASSPASASWTTR